MQTLDDVVIDPVQTRAVLSLALGVRFETLIAETFRFGVFRM